MSPLGAAVFLAVLGVILIIGASLAYTDRQINRFTWAIIFTIGGIFVAPLMAKLWVLVLLGA